MAIITDATGRQLAQAVGGIDTGGLAKDTTLQATNTALGNINTTEQSIASAIVGLGQTLGNDKANISGDNIADKSTFRQNIGAVNLVVLSALVDVSYQDSYTIGYRTTEKTKVAVSSLSGYPTGQTIVGMIAQATNLYGGEAFIDDSGYIRACTKTSISSLSVKVFCFYL